MFNKKMLTHIVCVSAYLFLCLYISVVSGIKNNRKKLFSIMLSCQNVIIQESGCNFKELENDAVLKENVSMSLVAKLSCEVHAHVWGSIPNTMGWRRVSRRGRKKKREEGKEKNK